MPNNFLIEAICVVHSSTGSRQRLCSLVINYYIPPCYHLVSQNRSDLPEYSKAPADKIGVTQIAFNSRTLSKVRVLVCGLWNKLMWHKGNTQESKFYILTL